MSKSILEEAQELIHGQRNVDYGHPRDNITHTANMFGAYLGIEVTPLDVCNLMAMLKMSRVHTTGYHRDSIVDIAGYAGVAERVYEEPAESEDDAEFARRLIPDELLGELTPEKKIARVWRSLADVPEGVVVEDMYGDLWRVDNGQSDMKTKGESWSGYKPLCEIEDNYAPFTEVLGEDG